MKCILYQNKSDNNHLNKDLVELNTVDIILKEQTAILNPDLLFKGGLDLVGKANYLYLPDLNRYYYITGIDSVRNGLWMLKCKVDVLMSYREEILKQSAVISRQEFKYNLLLDDGTLKSYADSEVVTKTFPTGFNSETFSYVVVGAGGKVPKE